jgi:hypothetical protein
VIVLRALNLPEEFYFEKSNPELAKKSSHDLLKRLIFCTEDASMISRIGIGCGCYAKGHRQIAHIKDKMKS